MEKIKELAKEQQELKTKIKSSSCSKVPKTKIVYSPEEKEKFKEALLSHRKFQR